MFTLRQATTEDIDILYEIAEKTWFVTYREILSLEQLDYMFDMMYSAKSIKRQMTELNHVYFIAFSQNKPIGYVSVEKQRENLFHLHKLYVLPEFQGIGAGKTLIEKAFTFAKENSLGKDCAIELNMNRNNKALAFYKKMGMYISDEGDFDIGNGYFMNDYIFRINL
jgi:diamine N-acetyltransferase